MLAFTTCSEYLGKGTSYDERSNFMSDDETHNDIDGNLVRPFWGHAQIEEKNADFQEAVGD